MKKHILSHLDVTLDEVILVVWTVFIIVLCLK
jgi:hypothetical protein